MLDEATIVARLRAAGCVFAEDEARLLIESATSDADLGALLQAREAGRPLEQVLGWAEFCGLRVHVAPGVFVPRRRTEYLVEQAVAFAASGAIVVDLCCGTGAVGLALATAVHGVDLRAVDLDPAAVGCARTNLAAVGGSVYCGDLLAPLPADLMGRVDVVIANAPYVPTDEIRLMPPEARLHEPQVALDGGSDGLAIQRRIVAAAPRWLRPGGALLIEASVRSAAPLATAMRAAGLAAEVRSDEQRAATVAIGVIGRG